MTKSLIAASHLVKSILLHITSYVNNHILSNSLSSSLINTACMISLLMNLTPLLPTGKVKLIKQESAQIK